MPLTALTARDFITLALKESGILGVGQTALSEDINDCFVLLQRMTSQWQWRRWMVPGLTDILKVGNNAISNTIGPGGYWNVTPRPDQILGGYFIQLNTGITPVSLPLAQVFSYEDYIRITVKNLNTFPSNFFYDGNNDVNGRGNVFIWPIPSAIYEIHLLVKSDLAWPQNINSVFTLPDAYAEAVHYNLTLRICSMYQVDPKPSVGGLAKVALNTIKNTNTQIPELQMPVALKQGKAFSLWNPDGM